MWEFVLQLFEFTNNIFLKFTKEEEHYDTVDCNESTINPSCALYPLIKNIINNHDDDVYSSDGTKNEGCDDHTELIRSSTVNCVSSEHRGSYPFMHSYYYISLLFDFMLTLFHSLWSVIISIIVIVISSE